jgi:hypothetical protein
MLLKKLVLVLVVLKIILVCKHCLDIGRYGNDEAGKRLNLTEHESYHVIFVDAASHEADQFI